MPAAAANYNHGMRPIYLDHNATTPLLPEARDAMLRAAEIEEHAVRSGDALLVVGHLAIEFQRHPHAVRQDRALDVGEHRPCRRADGGRRGRGADGGGLARGFGRVALLDMDAPLIGHAHHHCHILIKAGGADSAFNVRGERAPLTDESAVLVNAWEHHAYEHDAPPGQRTLILALYIEPSWLAELQRSLTQWYPRYEQRVLAAPQR